MTLADNITRKQITYIQYLLREKEELFKLANYQALSNLSRGEASDLITNIHDEVWEPVEHILKILNKKEES